MIKGLWTGFVGQMKNKVIPEVKITKDCCQQSLRFCHARKPPNSIYHDAIPSKKKTYSMNWLV